MNKNSIVKVTPAQNEIITGLQRYGSVSATGIDGRVARGLVANKLVKKVAKSNSYLFTAKGQKTTFQVKTSTAGSAPVASTTSASFDFTKNS